MLRIDRRRARYAAPVVMAGVVALGAAIPGLTAGASTPDLPALTPQQLIAKVDQAHVSALQGTVQWTANLGLPDVSGLVSGDSGQVASSTGFDPTTLLSGTHSIEVWTDGARQRLALPRSMAETDLVRDGSQVWLYDSTTQNVTHYVLTSGPGSRSAGGSPIAGHAGSSDAPALTPDQVAAKVLADLTPSTQVAVSSGSDVAGQPTYLLSLSPAPGSAAAADTTLGRVTISVDATNGLPLDVSVYGKGVTAPAVELAYTSVSFTTPSAANFQAPVGTSTRTVQVGSPARSGKSGAQPPTVTGPPWAWVISEGGSGGSPSALGGALGSSEIQSVTTAVSGSFGSGRLLSSNLVNVLILPDGRVLAGFVSPAALEAAAGAATP